MAKQDEKLQAYEKLTTQMNATTVALDAEKRQKLYEILHQKPEFAQLLEKFKALCSDDETRKAISEVCPASEADDHFDFKAMLQSMGAYCKIDPDKDGYVFNWPGKQTAIQLANEPTENTLIPDKADSRDWDTTQNIYIEGDNLEVLKCLRNTYAGKVKMIYIDPPYNTGNDFIYNDDFHGEKVSSDDAGKHTKWLNMMYSRLMLARELLSDDGVVFISIDDNEMANLNEICNLVFGSNNYIAQLIWKSKSGGANDSRFFAVDHEYVVCVSKNSNNLHPFMDQEGEVTTNYNYIDENGEYALERLDKQSLGYQETLDFPITGPDGKIYVVEHKNQNAKVARWRWGIETVKERYNELVFKNGYVYTKNYKKDDTIARSIMFDERYGRTRTGKTDCTSLFGMNIFDNPKPIKLLQYLINISTDGEDIILDLFSGSSTTAHAVLLCNNTDQYIKGRRFIMIQWPEEIEPIYDKKGKLKEDTNNKAIQFLDSIHKPHNIAEIGKARIRKAGDKIKADNPLTTKDLDIGFRVFRVGKSNIPKWWRYDGTEKNIEMFDAPQNKRTDEDKYRAIAYEFMLKHKCMLDARVDEYLTPEQMAKTGGKPLFVVDGALFICPVGGVNAGWATSVVALRRSRYAMTSNDAWFVAVNDTLDDSSDNRDSDKLLAVKTLVEAGLPAKHFLHI